MSLCRATYQRHDGRFGTEFSKPGATVILCRLGREAGLDVIRLCIKVVFTIPRFV